jgi:hypothetical protein
MAQERFVIDFPLRGEWLVISPPSHPRHAFDIVAIESARIMRGGLGQYVRGRLRADDSPSWSAAVTAPMNGVVVTATDGSPDRAKLGPLDFVTARFRAMLGGVATDALAGNHVIIRSGSHAIALAHLRCGSVGVRPRDDVAAGDRIGEVGNSGSSVVPHLHLQSVGSRRRRPFAWAPPFEVREFEQWRGGRWRVLRMAALPRFGRIRVA